MIDQPDYRCGDCGINVAEINEFAYIIHRELWERVAIGVLDRCLCLGCLEKRLGRQLTKDDLWNGGWNQMIVDRSERLKSRIEAWQI